MLVIDSHTHLDLCEPSNAELIEAADAVGVSPGRQKIRIYR